ncbi:MAG: hypothetical protein IT537_01995 [Hyphomicrobiales bacterium]|nr:hypothetical protein [Hyphomicrobiales bacterium]
MPISRLLLVLLALALGPCSAHGAEVAYPPGSRVGLVPPAGMVPSRSFVGFEDAPNSTAIILVALPAEAFAELDKTVTADALKRQGVVLEAREAFSLDAGKAFLVIGRQEADKTKIRKWILVVSTAHITALVTVQMPEAARAVYSDVAIRSALATVAIRSTVPTEEQLGLLPFKVSELAGFRVAGVMAGRAVVLSDAAMEPGAPVGRSGEPHILVAVSPGGPAQAGDRDAFARDVFATVPNLKEIRITGSEALRLAGHQGHQILATAKDASGNAVTVVQWLRFGGSGYLQLMGVAATDAWKDAYPRFRAVRDGIEPR